MLRANSLLHHLDDPMVIWDTISRHASKGTPVFIMDLMRPASKDRAEELVHLYAENESPILKKDFYNSLLAAYTTEEVKEQLMRAHVTHLTVEALSDRHLLVWGKKP